MQKLKHWFLILIGVRSKNKIYYHQVVDRSLLRDLKRAIKACKRLNEVSEKLTLTLHK